MPSKKKMFYTKEALETRASFYTDQNPIIGINQTLLKGGKDGKIREWGKYIILYNWGTYGTK